MLRTKNLDMRFKFKNVTYYSSLLKIDIQIRFTNIILKCIIIVLHYLVLHYSITNKTFFFH